MIENAAKIIGAAACLVSSGGDRRLIFQSTDLAGSIALAVVTAAVNRGRRPARSRGAGVVASAVTLKATSSLGDVIMPNRPRIADDAEGVA